MAFQLMPSIDAVAGRAIRWSFFIPSSARSLAALAMLRGKKEIL